MEWWPSCGVCFSAQKCGRFLGNVLNEEGDTNFVAASTDSTVRCLRRITHIHHLQWWDDGGETNLDNGVPLCSYHHHHLVHDYGWTITWNPHAGITAWKDPTAESSKRRSASA